MKHLFVPSVFCISILVFASCKKTDCFPTGGPEKFYRLEKVYGDFNLILGDQTGTFTYNSKGNPISFTKKDIGTGNGDMIFRYNDKGWPSDFIMVYKEGLGFERWDSYTYLNNGKNIIDSVFVFGKIVNNRPSDYSILYLHYLEMDARGRVIKDSAVSPQEEPVVSIYTYDSKGNFPGMKFDNKINWHRLNKFFQLIDRDFCQNNLLDEKNLKYSYNNIGLPVKITQSQPNHYFLTTSFTRLQFEYSFR